MSVQAPVDVPVLQCEPGERAHRPPDVALPGADRRLHPIAGSGAGVIPQIRHETMIAQISGRSLPEPVSVSAFSASLQAVPVVGGAISRPRAVPGSSEALPLV